MTLKEAWLEFVKSGSIFAYLNYVKIKNNQ